MLRKSFISGLALGLVSFSGQICAQTDSTAVVTGTVTYRARMALPPDATVKLRLEDVSRQDAPAKLITEVTIQSAGKQVPIPFQLTYDPVQIDKTHRYVVRARILARGEVLFSSTAAYPVITNGSPNDVTIIVEPVTKPSKPTALEDTQWNLIELSGEGVQANSGLKEPFLTLRSQSKQMIGSAGCNRLFGSYLAGKRSLRIESIGSTKMACDEAVMKTEQAFIQALQETRDYRINGQKLEFRRDGRVVARFEVQQP